MSDEIRIEGLDGLLRRFSKMDAAIRKAAMQGVQRGALQIIADAQVNLRNNHSVVTGLLRQSGRVQKVDEENVDAGFFDNQNKQRGYAAYVEYGRPPGKMPPPDELAQWAYKKFQLHDRKAARAAGWALAMKIAAEGTTPHPFFGPAVEKNGTALIHAVRDAVNNVTR